MGCCGEIQERAAPVMPNVDGLPDSTFCCMAKMAYAVSRRADFHYTGRSHATWESLPPEDRDEFARQARAAMRGKLLKDSNPLDLLFYDLLRLVTSTV
jgi:hypothetical protein